MNFYFEEGDIVVRRSDAKGLDFYVLVKGFDPIPTGFRVWWADPWNGQKSNPNKRIRTYTKELIRIRRPKEEERLRKRAERWAEVRKMAAYHNKIRADLKERARLRKHGVSMDDMPFRIPPGKWLTPEGVRQVLTDLGFKEATVEKRVQIAERLFQRRR